MSNQPAMKSVNDIHLTHMHPQIKSNNMLYNESFDQQNDCNNRNELYKSNKPPNDLSQEVHS